MKIELGAQNCLYPMPTTLVGATVEGGPNFITIAHVGIMDLGSVSPGMAKAHYTNAGIKENGTFSINLPSADMVKETDYCGLVSGKHVDKAQLFHVFYGNLKTAPMIAECPISTECRHIKVVDFPKHDVFIGEIVTTYAEDAGAHRRRSRLWQSAAASLHHDGPELLGAWQEIRKNLEHRKGV